MGSSPASKLLFISGICLIVSVVAGSRPSCASSDGSIVSALDRAPSDGVPVAAASFSSAVVTSLCDVIAVYVFALSATISLAILAVAILTAVSLTSSS